MGTPRFVHLRLHSEYSVTDGIVRIEDAVERAAADRMPALALTDGGNVFGMVKFYRAARAAGIKPIVGVDCWLQREGDIAEDEMQRVFNCGIGMVIAVAAEDAQRAAAHLAAAGEAAYEIGRIEPLAGGEPDAIVV